MSDHYIVTFDDLLNAHEEALRHGGGAPGVKDEAQLLSALGRPYQEFEGFVPYPTVLAKAGCLLHGLLNNHGFNDASKRTSWIVCNGFLYVERCALILPDDLPWYDSVAQMVRESWDVAAVTDWLATYLVEFESHDALREAIETRIVRR